MYLTIQIGNAVYKRLKGQLTYRLNLGHRCRNQSHQRLACKIRLQ